MKLVIAGITWKIRLLNKEKFMKIHGDENDDCENVPAITDVINHIVDFRSDDINIEHIRHELLHVYKSTQVIESADLNEDQIEEIYASLMGRYLEDYYKNTLKIEKWLKKQLTKLTK